MQGFNTNVNFPQHYRKNINPQMKVRKF